MKDDIITLAVVMVCGVVVVTACGCQEAANSDAESAAGLDQERKVVSLAGQWLFRLDPQNVGEDERWYERKLADRIRLPGSTAENGYGDDVSVETKWTGHIVDQSWFTDAKYERYRQAGSVKLPFWLTPLKHYVGPAWYQKEVRIPESWRDKRIVLFLERCHWETRVWVDGVAAGMQDSLCVPHTYDLSRLMTPGKHVLSIRVDNSVKYNVGINAHSVSDHTQTNWNGIIGRIELQATDRIWVSDVQVYPDVKNKVAKVRVTIGNATNREAAGTLQLSASSWNAEQEHAVSPSSIDFTSSKPDSSFEVDYRMGPGTLLWDEFSPAMYELTVSLRAATDGETFHDQKTVTFGMREFRTRGTQFTINERLTFLRGTLECCIFPLTGYPDMSVDGWLRIFRIAKAHGLNHMRFHSWCPPEAAFEAADQEGFMFQVECATWSTVGDGNPIDKFIYAEGDRILEAYGNHPSFCMLAYGNEPGGRNQRRFLGELVNYWREKDSRRLYTSAAGWPIIPESQYHSDYHPRGHLWGAGLASRFNATGPETMTDYWDFVERYDVPLVSHEIGQWCVYPNLKEIEKYKGVLRAYNFEIFRDSLVQHHMLDLAEDFLMASGRLQAKLYKEEIETAVRTPGFGGFQLLDIHDFPGQGTALVGVLDAFWDSKGYIEPQEHHRFCSETVPLLRMEKRTWTRGETFSADVEIAHFGPGPIEGARPEWSIRYADGKELASGQLASQAVPVGNGMILGRVEVPLVDVSAPARLSVTVRLEGTPYANDWDIWVYPSKVDTEPPEGVIVAESLDEDVSDALNAGKKVLLMPVLSGVRGNIPAGFTTIFWNTQWTGNQPPHTLGILCDPKHPALAEFPTEFHSNWQWWDLVTKSRSMVLDEFGAGFRPIVQVIDDWNSNRKLGLVFEAKVGKGKLLVCSIDLRSNLDERPVARQMLYSLLRYMGSSAFAPRLSVDTELIRSLLKEPPLLSRATVQVDSEAQGYEGRNAIDGDPSTIWHTPWGGGAPGYPHEIQIELAGPRRITGFRYLPRQDMSNGWIAKYQIYVSRDGKDWGEALASGDFEKNGAEKEVLFEKPVTGRFIRLVALSGFDGQVFASIAEFDIIPGSDK